MRAQFGKQALAMGHVVRLHEQALKPWLAEGVRERALELEPGALRVAHSEADRVFRGGRCSHPGQSAPDLREVVLMDLPTRLRCEIVGAANVQHLPACEAPDRPVFAEDDRDPRPVPFHRR